MSIPSPTVLPTSHHFSWVWGSWLPLRQGIQYSFPVPTLLPFCSVPLDKLPFHLGALYSFLKLTCWFRLQTSELKRLPALLWPSCIIARHRWLEPPKLNYRLTYQPSSGHRQARESGRERAETCPVSSTVSPWQCQGWDHKSLARSPAHSANTWPHWSPTPTSQPHPRPETESSFTCF